MMKRITCFVVYIVGEKPKSFLDFDLAKKHALEHAPKNDSIHHFIATNGRYRLAVNQGSNQDKYYAEIAVLVESEFIASVSNNPGWTGKYNR